MNPSFQKFADELVTANDERLFNEGPKEQTRAVLGALSRIDSVSPLTAVTDEEIDLAGFGVAPVRFSSASAAYLLLSQVADQLGWFLPRAHDWARQEHADAVAHQRRTDEERGDGLLGWECLRDLVPLDLDLVVDDPQAQPDANGCRWSSYSDWLVSRDRLPSLLLCSPWGREFMDNSLDAFGHAARKFLPGLRDVPTYGPDGQPTGGNAYDDLCRTDLTEQEALRKARRGPALDQDGGEGA